MLDSMRDYHMARDDWDTVNEIGSALVEGKQPKIDKNVKSAFTRK